MSPKEQAQAQKPAAEAKETSLLEEAITLTKTERPAKSQAVPSTPAAVLTHAAAR